jgi:hypothetical protein
MLDRVRLEHRGVVLWEGECRGFFGRRPLEEFRGYIFTRAVQEALQDAAWTERPAIGADLRWLTGRLDRGRPR